ncbi:DUF547 domain-containing protein [Ruegeria sp. 2205SS24-7]|uniref:DUF547 domain-containing protein n=1 Tax=Ruegeria discodermiae TaxID=3064389 RepID=UPI002740928F|nr:DUF547 domain-containing protein [Ruegeria sp. 2205SS24-7]MDP5218350.1 DUF547 domain-containing protein [Ruegeria sp. 2205SS24-7]
MRKLLILLLLPLLAACASIERVALPAPEPLAAQTWTPAAAPPGQRVNHGAWNSFLQTYVAADERGVNRVAYAQVTDRDRARLDGYIAQLQGVEPSRLTRDQQLAYWINLYNALTVDVILENYPVDSIRDITDGALSFGPWDRPLVVVSGRTLTLNDIEHRIIRPTYKEPRIHHALNCAAVGCPNLMDRAWQADTLERDLAAAERAYVNDPRGVRFDDNGRLILSKIYIWFREDFGPNERAVIAQISQAAAPELQARLRENPRVRAYKYDWALNERRNVPDS